MKMKLLATVLLIVHLANCAENSVEKVFKENEITKDVFPKPPKAPLELQYPGKEVKFGNELLPADVKQQPRVNLKPLAEPNSFYTLIMTDPDAPSRKNPQQKEWKHWIVANIPGADISKGQVISEYAPSAPPKNTGLHRYVFLLFKQPGKIDFTETKQSQKDAGSRGRFSTKQFVEKYGLGAPVAGNFFQAKYNEGKA